MVEKLLDVVNSYLCCIPGGDIHSTIRYGIKATVWSASVADHVECWAGFVLFPGLHRLSSGTHIVSNQLTGVYNSQLLCT